MALQRKTAPISAEELYGYDGRSSRSFSTKPVLGDPGNVEVLDIVGLVVAVESLTF